MSFHSSPRPGPHTSPRVHTLHYALPLSLSDTHRLLCAMHRSVIDYTPGLVDLGLSGVKEYTDSAENHPLHAITPLSLSL